MDFSLTSEQHDLRLRARAFADALLPYEVAAEESGGKVAAEVKAEIRRLAKEARLIGGNHAVEHGGQGWKMMEHVIVHEELGRITNGLWWLMGGGYNVLALGTPEQIESYLLPTLTGERADAYAVTERNAGSDASGIEATAERFLRELRVDRIWEGTTEIQRLIVANALVKRGVGATLAVDSRETV